MNFKKCIILSDPGDGITPELLQEWALFILTAGEDVYQDQCCMQKIDTLQNTSWGWIKICE